MDIVIKKVSVECLCTLKFYLEGLIHDIEMQIPSIEKDLNCSSKFSKDFYLGILKDKKEILSELRNIYKQI